MVTRRAERSIATNGRLQSSRLRTRRAAHAAVRPRIDSWSWRRRGDSTPNYACMRETRSAPATPGGEDSRPPIRAPASALRRARPPPSDGGRAPHATHTHSRRRARPWPTLTRRRPGLTTLAHHGAAMRRRPWIQMHHVHAFGSLRHGSFYSLLSTGATPS